MLAIQEQVLQTLADLGPDCMAIAHTLTNKGVKGVQSKTGQCPLAVYIAEQYPELYDFRVDADTASTLEWEIGLTPALQNFAYFFDAGAFHELIAS